MKTQTTYADATFTAAQLLGKQVRLGRMQRRWTMVELAERVGVTPVTIGKVEKGDPSVALGTALEAAILVGVNLFGGDATHRSRATRGLDAELALLPKSVRRPAVDDDF